MPRKASFLAVGLLLAAAGPALAQQPKAPPPAVGVVKVAQQPMTPSDEFVGRIVATVDALPRHSLGSSFILPLHTPRGMLRVGDTQGILTASASNAERYAPYMAIVQHADPQALVAWYVHSYPLFQQAYRELGYPKGYFNDRLIAAIDDMLAAPVPAQPPALQLVQGRYLYVDPTLESLSVGQKLMLRLGPANEAQLKLKLRAIRALLTAQSLPAAPGR